MAPFNAFLDANWLGGRLKMDGRANLLLAGPGSSSSVLREALRERWQLADAELQLREIPVQGGLEVRTGRVFLDQPSAAAALKQRRRPAVCSPTSSMNSAPAAGPRRIRW